MARKELPEINASSLADIAFLLLTFFLIATSINKSQGITRVLPDYLNQPDNPPEISKRNILRIHIDSTGQISKNQQEILTIESVKELVKKHVDNAGGVSASGEVCDYCSGERLVEFSEHPTEAIVSIEFNKATSVKYYFAVLNEVKKGYSLDSY